VARMYAQPIGSNGLKLIWINTWNCWGETATFEPTANFGLKYPAGNYQFDMLNESCKRKFWFEIGFPMILIKTFVPNPDALL
jgi:hypothetical protein